MNSVPKLFSCCYADCWTENHFSTEFGVLTPNHTHSHTFFWGCVSRWFGRALAWHARGHRFDSGILHQKEKHRTETCGVFCCYRTKEKPMSYAIVFSSKTGNTKLLADTLHTCLPQESCCYFGTPDPAALEADVLYVGFWTD